MYNTSEHPYSPSAPASVHTSDYTLDLPSQGWDGVVMSAMEQWLQDVTRTQLHKFLVGMAPVKRCVHYLSRRIAEV